MTDLPAAQPLDPEILPGGVAWVALPEPPADHRWNVEWSMVGTGDWHSAARGLNAGEHLVPDIETPEPQHPILCRAVAQPPESHADGNSQRTSDSDH